MRKIVINIFGSKNFVSNYCISIKILDNNVKILQINRMMIILRSCTFPMKLV